MSAPEVVKVQVPATTANLGPGFDCLGLALALYNTVELSVSATTDVRVTGEGAGQLPLGDANLVLRAAHKLARDVDIDVPGWRLRQDNHIPLARGLGSSSAAIVGGLVAANQLLGINMPAWQLLQVATEMEGHPDNVAPALSGGLTVCGLEQNRVHCASFPPPRDLAVGLVIPDFEVSTELARSVLPSEVPFADAVFNATHTALLLAALLSEDWELLRVAMKDRLHQPYRAQLVPGMGKVIEAAVEAGAYGAALSGSGPAVVAFAGDEHTPITDAMLQAFAGHGVRARVVWTSVSAQGAFALVH